MHVEYGFRSFVDLGRRGRASVGARDPSVVLPVSPTVDLNLHAYNATYRSTMRVLLGVMLVASLLVGEMSPAQAQDDLQYGFTLGVNRVTLETSVPASESYFAFVGGVILRQPLYGPLSLQSGLLLDQKGVRIEAEGGGAVDYGAGYLEIPLLVHLEAPPVRSITLHGEAGGFGAVKLIERQSPGGGDVDIALRTGESFYRRIDAGLVAGVGATIPIRGQRLNLTVRRTWGLRDVAQDVGDPPFPEAPFPSEGETRTWALLLRLGF